jgi:adenylate cyclase
LVTPGIAFDDFRLDPQNQCLWRGADQVELSPKAFAVLAFLAERAGRLVTKQELLDGVWPDIHVTEGVLKRAILEIRKALGDDAEEPRYVQTLHRRGYRFLPEVGSQSPAPPKPDARPDRSRIAVLPFVNMSSDAENEYFSDGLTEELINRLASIPGLQVVARTSAFRFKRETRDLREIGALLNVGTVLEGSVRWAGDQVRMTAQLIDVESGYHLFSRAYQRQYRDLFQLQDEMARAVAAEIAPHAGAIQPVRTQTDNLEAYQVYLRGLFALSARFIDLPEALQHFRQAISLSPEYAPAWAGLAHGYFLMSWFYKMRTEDGLRLAREAAQKALALDPDSALGLGLLAGVESACDWRWQEAEARFRRALELQPGLPNTYLTYCYCCLIPQLRIDEACTILERGLSNDPFNPLIHGCLVDLYGRLGRYDDALRQHATALSIAPDYAPISVAAGLAHEWNGHLEKAIPEYRRACELSRHAPYVVSSLAHALARLGEREEPLGIARQLEETGPWETDTARVYLGLRDFDEALRWLELAAERRTLHLFRVSGDPRFDPLLPHPRFQQILRAMGLPITRSAAAV